MQIHIDTVTIGTLVMTGPPAPTFRLNIGPIISRGSHTMPTEVTMSSEHKAKVTVTPLTPGGEPATLDGPVQFSIAGACTLAPIDDVSTWVEGVEGGADSVLTIQGDADLGEGIVHIMDTVVFHVTHPQAAQLGVAVEAPVLKSEDA